MWNSGSEHCALSYEYDVDNYSTNKYCVTAWSAIILVQNTNREQGAIFVEDDIMFKRI